MSSSVAAHLNVLCDAQCAMWHDQCGMLAIGDLPRVHPKLAWYLENLHQCLHKIEQGCMFCCMFDMGLWCNICTVGTTVLTQFTLMPEASLGKPLFTNESSIVLTKLTGQIIWRRVNKWDLTVNSGLNDLSLGPQPGISQDSAFAGKIFSCLRSRSCWQEAAEGGKTNRSC